uniref:Muscle M-line assembly protein unc-89 n=1 Tax=Plectus sambesii TaxID=2011161 RepID=A0A914WDR8_9BILA
MASRRLRESRMAAKYSSYKKYTASEDVSFASHSSRSSFKSESLTERSSESGSYSSNKEVISGTETRTLPVFIAIQDFNPEPGDKDSMPLEQGQIVEVLDGKNPASWLVRTKARPPRSGWIPGSYFETPTEYYKQRRRTREITGGDLKMTEKEEAIVKRECNLSDQVEAGGKTMADYLKLPRERMAQYQAYFKEFIKYTTRAELATKGLQKALELTMSVPQRANDMVYIRNIQEYPGDSGKLGRLLRHEPFTVWEGEERKGDGVLRYVFLFKSKLMLTERVEAEDPDDPPDFKHIATIRLDKYDVKMHSADEDVFIMKPTEPGLPVFCMRALDQTASEFARQAWVKDICETKEAIVAELEDMETDTGTEFASSDARSEFSEYSTMSRKSSFFAGPEEGPPRKKTKSPPVISPTGSSASLYSGSSSLDWTTTGTTLEMQGTRVTRTQYGFRTLQESSAKMCLKVTGYPLPDITWYKDEQLLSEDERHTFYADDDGFFAMTIDPVQVDDTGRYTCMATNEYGQASTSAFFRVLKVEKEPSSPKFVSELKDLEIKEGEIANFECEVEGWPEPELVWLVDDQPLRPSHDFKLEFDGQKAKLEIRDAQPEDTGTYSVRIKNEFGTTESLAKLTVDADPDKNHVAPEFQAGVEDMDADEGDTVRFKAVLTGDPTPEVTWFINGVPLSESDKVKFISEDGICIVTIKDVTRHFDGVVSCQAVNRLGTESSEARLSVRTKPMPPQFDRPLEDKTAQEKDTVVFEADVSGSPDPDVTWFIGGKQLVNGEKGVTITSREGGFHKLELADVLIDTHDGKEIICKAVNEHGQAESRARLTVETADESVSKSAPTFMKDITDQTVTSGQKATFETTVKGEPNPTVSWYVNGHKVDTTSPGATTSVANWEHKLTLDSTQYAGTVVCRAENAVGKFETKARLIVLDAKPKSKAPEFTEPLTDKTVDEGSSVQFEATAVGEPMPKLTWYVNGKQVAAGSSDFEIKEFNGSAKLEIAAAKASLAGEIVCKAENEAGTAETKATLTLTKKPSKPVFELKPKDVTTEKGVAAVFTAKATGEPQPTYTWSHGGKKLDASMNGVKIEESDGATTLTLDTNIFDSRAVSLVAQNASGSDEANALLTVESSAAPEEAMEVDSQVAEELQPEAAAPAEAKQAEEPEKLDKADKEPAVVTKPVIKKPLQDQKVQEGDLAHFEAVIENADTVTWYVNGSKVDASSPGVKISDEDSEYRITLDSKQYAGTVSCTAQNAAGSVETKAKMIVLPAAAEVKAPEFTDMLKPTQVTEGEQVKVDVIAMNSPEFTWTLKGKPLKDGVDGVKIINDGGKSTLIIPSAKLDDAGELAVKAKNAAGEAECSAPLTVGPRATAPEFLRSPDDQNVTAGEPAVFEAAVAGEPQPKITWQLNGTPIDSNTPGVTVLEDDGASILNIDEAKVSQIGEVVCTARNSAGTATKSAKLNVTEKQVAPQFTVKLTDRNVDEGDPIRMDAAITGQPAPKVSWYLNGKQLTPSDDVQMVDHGDGTYHLAIANAKPEMTGDIVCKAEGPAGSAESAAKINVQKAQKKPEFTKEPSDHTTTEDEAVKFRAEVIGEPKPSVAWYLNGKELTQSDDVKIKVEDKNGGVKTSVEFLKPALADSGTVTAKAKNSAGAAEASAKLTVEKKLEPPKFKSDMDDRVINEGQSVKYTVKVDGYPKPEITWFINGEKVGPSTPNVKISEDNGQHTIEISSATPEQTGEVACQATNAAGQAKKAARLKVNLVGEAPLFTKYLADQLVTEKELVLMEAKLADVKPKPTVSWFKDGKPLKEGDGVKIIAEADGTLKLQILQAQTEHGGRITIKAENHFGSAETSANIGIQKRRPQSKPQFLSQLTPINLNEGDTLQTKVLITGDPTPSAKWYINGQLVVQTEDTELTAENGVYSLTIHGVSADMTGKIKCVAYNKMGEAEISGPITVIAPIPVEFETSLCDATCREGDTLKLKAVLLGEPTPDVTWYINGKMLEESNKIRIHADKGTYTVTIKDITCDYSGKVVCKAVNEFGEASSEATLLVLPRGEPPDFLEWLSNVGALENSVVVHKVVYTGDPTPRLTWYINNEEIKWGRDDIHIETDGKTSTLTIKKFDPKKHAGEIICKAENDAGEVSCTANTFLRIAGEVSESESEAMAEDMIDVEMDNMTETGSGDEELPMEEEMMRTPTPVMAPRFITKIKDTKAKRHHQAIFECVVPDTKGVCCKWLKDGKEIELIARIRVKSRTIEGFTTNELIIDDVEPEDAGKYTVIVSNNAGQDTCEAKLEVIEVLEKPSAVAPDFVVKLADKTVSMGEKVLFECRVTGEPDPTIQWLADGKVVSSTQEGVRLESAADGTQRLIIDSVVITQAGKYVCVAENVAGKQETAAKLTVKAFEPRFTRELTTVSVTEKETAILECTVVGPPQPTVSFLLDGKQITTSDHVIVQSDGTGNWTLKIIDATEKDAGAYTAVATNAAGTAKSKADLNVKHAVVEKVPEYQEAPAFTQPLDEQNVTEGESAALECAVTGKPEPTVQWLKDGKPVQVDNSHVIVKASANGQHALTIVNAKQSDVGSYTCKAVNPAGEAETAAALHVQHATQVEEKVDTETAPVFVEELNEAQVQQGETAVLECRVKSQSTPEILWYRDDKPIKPDGQHLVVETLDNGKLKLTINSATKEDVGTYKCVAVAKGGKAQTAAKLDLKHAAQQEEKMDTETAPVFVEELNEAQVQQGETAVLECRVESQSTPEILWFCDDKPIKPDGKHVVVETLDNGKLKLTIHSATKEDVGTYKCVAVAKGGKAQTAAKLDLKYAVQQEEAMEMEMAGGLEFVRPLQTITVPEGDEAILECAIASGVDDVQIAWSKDGGAVPKSAKVESKPDGTQRLTIGEARADDVGLYRCEANAAVGTAWTEGSLHVKAAATVSAVEGQGPPEFVEILHACDTVVDGEVKLKCKVKGAPAPKIRWLKDGKEVTMDARVKIESLPDGTQLLTVKKAAKEDIGEYRCEASNDLGAAWTEAPVSVKLATSGELPSEGIAPDFTEPIKAVEVAEGETAVLECKVVGEPAPEIKWFKGGEEIKPNDHFKIEAKPDGTQRLTIKNAKTDDIDEYRCEATNPLGSVWSDATLGVKLPVSSETDAMQQIAPTFVRTLEACDTAEGEEAAFECAIVGTPMPEIKWFKDNKEIKANDAHFKTEKFDDGTARLTIKEAVNADAGNFRCEATNPAGAARTDAPLTVHRAEESTMETEVAPEFLDDLRPVQADEGTAAVFECRVVGVPAPKVQWYKDGTPVKSGDGVVIEAKPDGTQRLKLDSAQVEDQGNYRCEATNPAGSMSSKAPLTVSVAEEMDVDESETAPEFTSPLQKCVAEEGAIAALECAVAGNVEKVTWYKDGKEVKPDNAHVKIESSPDGKQKLTILDAAAGDIGTYKCIVSNKVGEADTSGDLDVSATLKLKKGLEDQTLTQGSKLLLSIEVEGKPKTVKWYKGKDEIKASKTVKIEKKSESVYELVVDSAELSDSGSYKVVLSTETTSVDSSATVTVTEKVTEPTFKKGLSDKKVPKGSALALEIEVEGKPKSVKWFKDGKPIDGKKGKAEDLGDGKYRLTIPDVGDDDAGTYSVEVSNDAGTAKSEAAVKVGSDDKTPMMVRGLEDLTVKVGEKAVFEVEVSESVKVVKWYKNGKEVAASDRLKLNKVNEKKYQLAIAKATEDDTATYKVVLSNDAGSADSEASLTVKLPAEEPKFKKGLKDETVPVGAALQLEVEVTGKPKTVKWYKDGKEIGASAKIKIDKIDDNTYRLTIPSASPEDAGAYTVEIENEAGKAKSQGAVVVESTPEFLKGLEDLTVHVGEEVKFAVESSVVPKTIKWYKNGKEVKADNRVQLKSDEKKFQLVIAKAELTDAATYKVVLSNGAGDAESSAQLTVKKAAPGIPKIKKGLTDQNIPKGSPLTLSIEVEGEPTSVKWFKDGEEINPASTSAKIEKIGDNVYQLVIPSASPEDAGKYSVEVANDAGSAKSAGDVGVDEKPEIVKPLEDTTVAPGDDTILEVEVSAPPRVVKWYKNGREIKPDSRMKPKKIGDTKFQLAINRATNSDDLTLAQISPPMVLYPFLHFNPFRICNNSVALAEEKVERKTYAPKFNPGLSDTTGKVGGTITLSCVVDAIPTANIIWYKDGLPLRLDRRVRAERDDDGTCRLIITDVQESDDGAYRCVASNEHGTTNTACLVVVKPEKQTVKKEGEEPYFTKGLVDCWVDRSTDFTLKCAVAGDPKPEIRWYKNGTLVRSAGRVAIEQQEDGTCTLTVKDCTMSDEGIYRCEAENKLGRAKTQATVHVQLGIGKVEKMEVDESEGPKFVIQLEDMSVSLDSTIELECKVTGRPTPTIKWSKDGGPLREDIRYTLESEASTGKHRLTIRNATVQDEGTYRCVATNDAGSATTRSFVRIDDGLGAKLAPATGATVPRFTIKLGDVRATEGQPLKLECKVEASPKCEFVWYKDGEKVAPSDRVRLEALDDGTARLIIDKCTPDDEGIYRVIATNPAGTAHDKSNAVVKRLPKDRERTSVDRDVFDGNKAPKVIIPLESEKIKEDGTISLKCKFSGDPKPTLKWFKDGERVYAFGRCQIIEHSDGTAELRIDNATRMEGGGYRCVAENDYGSARTTAEIVVQPKEKKAPLSLEDEMKKGNAPGFSVPLVVRRVREGETAVFECLPYGNPFPAIKWLKDGVELDSNENLVIEALEDGTQRLTVRNVDFFADGFYRCVATNEYGTASTKAELIIDGDRTRKTKAQPAEPEGEPVESKPRFRRGLYNFSVHQGNTIEMQVCTAGWPTPTVKWFKDDVELKTEGPDGRRIVWTDDLGIHRCVILNAQPEDEGEYSVVATNKLGTARTEGTCTVIKPREIKMYDDDRERDQHHAHPPGFIRQLKNKHVFTNMPIIFDCLVVGHPPPEVEWFHNGKRIKPNDRIRIQASGGGSHSLIILKATIEDMGEYVAIAKNSQGQASSSAVLDVTAPLLDSIKFDGSIDVTPYLTEEYGFKKSHYTSIPTPPDRGPFIKEVTGHYLTLSWIPTKRAPPRYPQVTYVIEMRELPGKEWTLLDYNIPEPVCKVRNLELDKSYQFRVRAENIYGISDPSPSSPPSRLMAPPRPVMDKNKRIIPLLDPYGYTEEALNQAHAEQYACAPWFAPGVVEKRYCAENDTLTLTLNVSGYPDPNIAWKFRGWDVDTKDPLSKMRVSTFGGTETTLTVLGFSKDNVGQYQCIATNQYGDAQQNIFVDLAQRPNFLQPLMDKTFSSGKPLKLDVRVEGNPTPEIKWLKEWHPIVESSRIKIVRDGPYLVSLIINDPLWRDSGIYSCVAYNEAGKATTSCSVTVEGTISAVSLSVHCGGRRCELIVYVSVPLNNVSSDAHGTVYRAVEVKTGRRFLARRVPLSDLDALHREIGVRNCLWHPNIAAMHDAIIDKDAGWLFFENATSGLLDKLTATDSVREDQVALFVRQLLDALQEMHNRKIVHLDLKPETILLKDDQIKLADFGQSRRLLKGKPTYGVVGSPEFVSPEIVNSQPVTLATDLWSVGSLSYVLLSGISPFLGDSDDDTLDNVRRGAYSLSPSQFDTISDNAKDFITQLLNVDPSKRPTVAEALQHPWMLGADSKREQGQMLSTDCLREFKYRHKWVERRVFVQQSATDEETHRLTLPHLSVSSGAPLAGIKPLVPTPRAPRAADGYSTDPSVTAGRAEPADLLTRNGIDYYDLLRVKERPRMETDVDTLLDVSPERPKRRMDSRPDSIESSSDGSASPTHSPAKRHADTPADSSSARTPSSQSSQPGQNERQNERRRSIEDELANRILSDISEENSVAGSVASIDELEPGGAKPLKEYRRTRDGGRRSRSRSGTPKAPEFEPDGGATPTRTTPTGTPPPQGKMPPQGKTPPQGKPSTLLVGPDGAVVGQVGPDGKTQPLSVSIDPIEEYYGDSAHTPKIPQIDDPNVPVGAPMVIEGLKRQVTLQSGEARTPRSPRTRLPPGTKSPVHLSPTKEETMEVIIATKRGKLGFLSSPSEMVDELDDGTDVPNLQKARLSKHGDDFDDLMGEVDRFKKDIRSRRTLDDDLDKYRPKAFYGDDFGLPPRPEIDVDDYDWESNYQIGPETYLLAVRAPSFNARVRDYRRELWGDGAPLVTQGILGYRNMDITVRERRRYTDVIKEDAHIAKSVSMLDSQMRKTHEGAIRRVRSDISAPPVPLPTSFSNADGTFAPVFQTRLKEVAYTAETDSVTLQCSVIGRPTPTITWFHNESPIVDDGRREWSFENGRARLTIRKPQYSDSGVYTCQAENDHGQTLCVGRLKMGDMPERPGRPDIELASDTELYITWEAPTTVGGVEVLSYRLEYRKAGENDFSCPWLPISDQIDDEAVVLRHLDPLGVYQYRVTAKNCFGWGVPSLTSRIVRTHPRGAPKLNLEVLRAERHFNVVSMPQAAPVNANGFRALGEIKEDEEEGEETPVEKHAPQSLSDGPLFLNTADDPTRRFQLGKEIYRGRFGLLRDAVDSKSENASHCVGKVLIATGDRAAPAHSEFDLLREGQHENVVQLIAAYERDGFILLFTERLHETIFERFTYRDYYNEDQIARSIQQLAAGIHWLQFKGIVHLDVQPDNVMFTGKRSWNLKLVDFGSAVQRTATSQPKPHQSLNVEFAAPELLDKNGLVTSQCDIWGLGIITFCLLSGFHPYSSEDDTPEEVKENVCHQKCDPNLIYTQASQESLRFVTWALKKVPARRMNTEEALQHRWLAADDTMTRRRENIKYPSSRLCKLARRLAFQRKDHATDNNQLLSLYGAK